MTGRQLRLTITEPAKKRSSVEDNLADELLREVRARHPRASSAGMLPLLSHALDQAWRTHMGDILTLADYERTGGIEGVVADSAQRADNRLTPGQQAADRQVFTRLTACIAGVDSAARAVRAELTEDKSAAEARDVEAVLEAFAAERLLTLTLAAGTWRSATRSCRDPGTAGASAVVAAGQGKQPRCIGFSGCRWLPVWLPRRRTGSAADIWITVLPSERIPACASARRCIRLSDCLRAVSPHSDDNSEYAGLPAPSAPRPRLERGTYCLQARSR
jgi:hypothetical protein